MAPAFEQAAQQLEPQFRLAADTEVEKTCARFTIWHPHLALWARSGASAGGHAGAALSAGRALTLFEPARQWGRRECRA